MGKRAQELELRRQALQLGGQLPPDLHDARLVLDLMRQLVDGFLDAQHNGVIPAPRRGAES